MVYFVIEVEMDKCYHNIAVIEVEMDKCYHNIARDRAADIVPSWTGGLGAGHSGTQAADSTTQIVWSELRS